MTNKTLKLLLGTNSIILISAGMLAPLYALFVDKIGGTLFDAGLTVAVFAFSAGFVTLLAGVFSDKIKNRKLIIVAGYFIMGTGFFLLNFVESIFTLLLVQALIGIGGAIYAPAFDGIYSTHIDKNHESREWSHWEASYYFSTAIGAIIGGYLASVFGFWIIFTLMGSLSFTSAIFLMIKKI